MAKLSKTKSGDLLVSPVKSADGPSGEVIGIALENCKAGDLVRIKVAGTSSQVNSFIGTDCKIGISQKIKKVIAKKKWKD